MPTIDKAKFFDVIGYSPHPQQMLFHSSEARFRVACCGRRFGKSTMAARDLEPHLFLPKKRFWIVGPTYDLAEKEFRVIWDDLILGMKLGKDKRVKKAYNKRSGDMYIEFPWQTRVEARSADHPENLVGEALDGVIISEAAKQKEETWKRFIRPALTDKRGFATFPTTPEGFNWLHALWQLGQNPDHPLYDSWQFPSWANNIVYPEGRDDPEIQDLQNTTSPEWFAQEIAAEFTAFVGKVYGEFREVDHVRKHEFRPEWPNYMAIDWGFANPAAFIEFQVDPQDRIYIWREHYKNFMTVPEHIEYLRSRPQPVGYHLDAAYADAADPEAAQTFTQMYIPCHASPDAKSNWRQGVDTVKGFLKIRKDGLPGLIVDHSCVNTIREFNNYRTKAPVKGNNVPEMAQNTSDHAMDAIRYGIMHLFVLGANSHLGDVVDYDQWIEEAVQAEKERTTTYETMGAQNPNDVPVGSSSFFGPSSHALTGLGLHNLDEMSGLGNGTLFRQGDRF